MKPKARTVLAFVGIIGFILLIAGFVLLLYFGEEVSLPEGDLGKQIMGMIGMIVGTWNSVFLMIITFNFGSSQGSKDKEAMIEGMKKIT